MTNETRPSSESPKEQESAAGIESLLEKSESFAYFKKNGIRPPSESGWSKVLFELGPDTVDGKRGALQAYAEAADDKNLIRALKDFNPDAARLVAEMNEDDAEGKYAEMLEELRGLKEKLPDLQEKLKGFRKAYETDMDNDQYVDEFEEKVSTAMTRIRSIENQLKIMRAVFYIPEELIDQEFSE